MAVLRGDDPVGEVTTGTFSPTRRIGIGLALLDTAAGLADGDEVEVDVRGRRSRCTVSSPRCDPVGALVLRTALSPTALSSTPAPGRPRSPRPRPGRRVRPGDPAQPRTACPPTPAAAPSASSTATGPCHARPGTANPAATAAATVPSSTTNPGTVPATSAPSPSGFAAGTPGDRPR